jgi:hypothetical protein
LQESEAEIQDTEADEQEATFIVLAQTQRTPVQRLSPENKGVSPYMHLQAGYRSKKVKLNPHMTACDSIGYFISPVLCDFHVSILQVLSLSFVIPSPHLIIRTQLSLSLLVPLPATLQDPTAKLA